MSSRTAMKRDRFLVLAGKFPRFLKYILLVFSIWWLLKSYNSRMLIVSGGIVSYLLRGSFEWISKYVINPNAFWTWVFSLFTILIRSIKYIVLFIPPLITYFKLRLFSFTCCMNLYCYLLIFTAVSSTRPIPFTIHLICLSLVLYLICLAMIRVLSFSSACLILHLLVYNPVYNAFCSLQAQHAPLHVHITWPATANHSLVQTLI